MSRAAYMREYRARQKARLTGVVHAADNIANLAGATLDRIAELEAEVVRLKRELAARPLAGLPSAPVVFPDGSFIQFRPVPKPGRK